LIKVRVQNYRSVEDSGEFEISDLTCLVGKNEAGKTAERDAWAQAFAAVRIRRGYRLPERKV